MNDPETAKKVVEALEGISREAARSEPFTWLMLLFLVALIVIGGVFALKLVSKFGDIAEKHSTDTRTLHEQTCNVAADCKVALQQNTHAFERFENSLSGLINNGASRK